MRYKRQIWDMFIKYTDEDTVIKYRENKGVNEAKAFNNMGKEEFNRILNTLRWLVKQCNKNIRIEEVITKPTDSDILEALQDMEDTTQRLLDWGKTHKDKVMRNEILKRGRSKLKCVEYYRGLVGEGYFKDK